MKSKAYGRPARGTSAKPIALEIRSNKPLLIVKVRVNGRGPFRFVVDTGASYTILAVDLAKRLGIPLTRRCTGAGVGGSLDAWSTKLARLQLGDIEVCGLSAVAMRLDAVSSSLGTRLGGILGYNLLRRYRVIIDYRLRSIVLETPRRSRNSQPQG